MIKSLVGKYLNTVSGLQIFQLLRFGAFFLISVIFVKSNQPTGSIGAWEMFILISSLLCSFWINGLLQSFLPLSRSNNTFGKIHEQKSPELFNGFILISILSVVAIVALVCLQSPLSKWLNHSEEIPFFRLLIFYIFFSCPSNLVEYIYLLKNKPVWILRYGLSTFTLQILIVSLPAVFGYPMEYCVGGLVGISLIRYIWLLVLLWKYASPKFSPAFIGEHLHFGAPLIISALLGSSASYVDAMIVLNRFDPATFAIFRYGAKEFPLVLLLANAFATAMIPEFSDKNNLAQSLGKLRRKSTNMMHFLFPATLVFLLLSNQLYPLVFDEEFTKSARIFNIYLLLISARLVFPHPIIIGQKKNRVIMYASLAEFVVNASLSLLFVRFWGIEGVAFATLIAYSVQKIIWVIYNKVKLGISPAKYINLKFLGFYTAVMAIIFYLIY